MEEIMNQGDVRGTSWAEHHVANNNRVAAMLFCFTQRNDPLQEAWWVSKLFTRHGK